MHYKDIHNLAWEFVDAARTRLDARLDAARMNALFVALGVGDYEAAIDTVLAECAGTRMTVAPALATRLCRWVAMFDERSDPNSRHEKLKSILGPSDRAC
ncbi:hypothetical protein [Mycolicibacterium sp. lyk4-40-TYG-92]|jgi:hypothetical protein|uniref:hypothetical protein n=1 Tax=Mycolicibacterium sp. lyk4-40-TYG-92 TaxID=3040295 RepID=UPI00254B0F5F|nr:hypothetical protein [Mycolicibacterium sp. lyk4-40-TYG-92]